MAYTLLHEKDERGKLTRTYTNEQGSEVKTQLIYTDEGGRKFWGFYDLYKIPVIRVVMSKHISDMYNVGLTLKDIQTWASRFKTLAKSNDSEKYEKIFAVALEMQSLAEMTVDPIKQHLALTTVYVLENDERIDYFDESIAERKLKDWKTDIDMVAFFLSWQTEHILSFTKTLDKASRTVSELRRVKELQAQSKP